MWLIFHSNSLVSTFLLLPETRHHLRCLSSRSVQKVFGNMYLSQVDGYERGVKCEGIDRWWRMEWAENEKMKNSHAAEGRKNLLTNKFCRRHIHHVIFVEYIELSSLRLTECDHPIGWLMCWNSMEMTINFPSFSSHSSEAREIFPSKLLAKHVRSHEMLKINASTQEQKVETESGPLQDYRLPPSRRRTCTPKNHANWHVLQQNCDWHVMTFY